jgi:hypothetical protein
MKVLKKTGNYLRMKALKNLLVAFLCLGVFWAILFSTIPGSDVYLNFGSYRWLQISFLIIPLLFGFYYFSQFRGYERGYSGERNVAKTLASTLGDEYSLINDVGLHDGYGNIDHVVIGPNGVFVIETKNYAGRVICHGDDWSHQYPSGKRRPWDRMHFDMGSPSKQAKRNAMRIRRVLESLDSFSSKSNWVDGVLVFPNPAVDLEVHGPTVPVMRLRELPTFITARKSLGSLSSEEVAVVGKEILRQANRH